MNADYKTTRLCPYCGQAIALDDAPIVVTNPEAEIELRELIDRHEWNPPSNGGSEHNGWAVRSRLDREERLVVAPPPSRNPPAPDSRSKLANAIRPAAPPTLTDPLDLVSNVPVFGLEPRRACPRCNHPLPLEVDSRHISTIVVAGVVAASKSTMLTRLCRLASMGHQFEELGFSEFVEVEDSPDDLDVYESQLRDGLPLDATAEPEVGGHYLPWVFQVAGRRKRREYLLFLHDVAGETYQNRSLRGRQAPFLGWADGLVFLIDPEPYLRPRGAQNAYNQAKVLQGILSAIRRPNAPVAIALAKSDMIPGADSFDPSDGKAVRAALATIGASAIVDAAASCPTASFHFLAANPENGGEPFGIPELFASISARCGLI